MAISIRIIARNPQIFISLRIEVKIVNTFQNTPTTITYQLLKYALSVMYDSEKRLCLMQNTRHRNSTSVGMRENTETNRIITTSES